MPSAKYLDLPLRPTLFLFILFVHTHTHTQVTYLKETLKEDVFKTVALDSKVSTSLFLFLSCPSLILVISYFVGKKMKPLFVLPVL